MILPWLPDGYHMRALQLIDRAPAPIVPPAPGVRLCDFAWCCAFADKKSGWPIEGPRRVSADDARNVPAVYPNRCIVHRERPDYRPRPRKYNLGRLYAADRPTRRRHAA
jgi:hypothetical protein